LKEQDCFSSFARDVKERLLSLKLVFALSLNLELEIAEIGVLLLLICVYFLRTDPANNQRYALSTLLF